MYPVETCCLSSGPCQSPFRLLFPVPSPVWLVWGRKEVASGPGRCYGQVFLVGEWLNQAAHRGNSVWNRDGSDHFPGHLRVRELQNSEPVLFCQKYALCKMFMMGREGWGLGVGQGCVGRWYIRAFCTFCSEDLQIHRSIKNNSVRFKMKTDKRCGAHPWLSHGAHRTLHCEE